MDVYRQRIDIKGLCKANREAAWLQARVAISGGKEGLLMRAIKLVSRKGGWYKRFDEYGMLPAEYRGPYTQIAWVKS